MSEDQLMLERRTLLKGAIMVASAVSATKALAQSAIPSLVPTHLADVPLASGALVTVERRGQIVLIGINRPTFYNRMDPETTQALAVAMTGYDRDDSLRCAVLFGHGDNFSRGIDVDAHKAAITPQPASTPAPAPAPASGPDPNQWVSIISPSPANRLNKPLIVVTHGDTWNLAHEIHLAADIRICSADVRFGQDETSHARFPGGGGTIRFVREVGWGNAMRFILTGDHWGAQEAYRMGEVQEIAPNKEAALEAGIRMANKVAACGPLGIKTALASAHLALNAGEPAAFAQLGKQYNDLYATKDFQEGRDAEAQNRPPIYVGQ